MLSISRIACIMSVGTGVSMAKLTLASNEATTAATTNNAVANQEAATALAEELDFEDQDLLVDWSDVQAEQLMQVAGALSDGEIDNEEAELLGLNPEEANDLNKVTHGLQQLMQDVQKGNQDGVEQDVTKLMDLFGAEGLTSAKDRKMQIDRVKKMMTPDFIKELENAVDDEKFTEAELESLGIKADEGETMLQVIKQMKNMQKNMQMLMQQAEKNDVQEDGPTNTIEDVEDLAAAA